MRDKTVVFGQLQAFLCSAILLAVLALGCVIPTKQFLHYYKPFSGHWDSNFKATRHQWRAVRHGDGPPVGHYHWPKQVISEEGLMQLRSEAVVITDASNHVQSNKSMCPGSYNVGCGWHDANIQFPLCWLFYREHVKPNNRVDFHVATQLRLLLTSLGAIGMETSVGNILASI
jgi:hypothetical protein